MGKKNKKSLFKRKLKPLFKGNKVLFAALGGAATGIAIANILGTEKAKEILNAVENSISDASDRISNGLRNIKNSNVGSESRGREPVQN